MNQGGPLNQAVQPAVGAGGRKKKWKTNGILQ
jgi:hypothetical protein